MIFSKCHKNVQKNVFNDFSMPPEEKKIKSSKKGAKKKMKQKNAENPKKNAEDPESISKNKSWIRRMNAV